MVLTVAHIRTTVNIVSAQCHSQRHGMTKNIDIGFFSVIISIKKNIFELWSDSVQFGT